MPHPRPRDTRPSETVDAVMMAAGDFAVLVGAIERKDFRLADEARHRLARRGYLVQVRTSCPEAPALTLRYAHPEADGGRGAGR